jgi:hypothetical protein
MSDKTPDDHLKNLCKELASRIQAERPMFEDHEVRADAGDAGMIYVALRGAKRELDAGEQLSDELASLIEGELDAEPKDIDFAISVGSGNKDLLFQIELRYV